jgi:hypothetical protein
MRNSTLPLVLNWLAQIRNRELLPPFPAGGSLADSGRHR